jgi:hypothetical protein
VPIQATEFTPKSREEHLEELIAGVHARTRLRNSRALAPHLKLMQLFARKFASADRAIWGLRHINDPFNAKGADLDEIGSMVLPEGLDRDLATTATTLLVFTRAGSSGALPIAQGQLVQRTLASGEKVTYQTTAAGAIPDGSGSNGATPIPAICLESGSVGSAPSGAINEVLGDLEVTGVSNVTPAVGLDDETDEDYLDRIISHSQSLARCTEPALVGSVRGVKLADGRRIPFITPVVNPGEPGKGTLYVDDGTGTIGQWEAAAAETLTASANGGEFEFYTSRRPWNQSPVVKRNGSTLVEGTDYYAFPSTGQIYLTTPLSASDALSVDAYSVWTGLVAEAERALNGDASNRLDYPGFRGWTTFPRIWPASVVWPSVIMSLEVKDGYTPATVRAAARDAVILYINNLPIGAPVIWTKLIERALSVAGAFKVTVTSPVEDLYPLPSQVYRATTSTVTVV